MADKNSLEIERDYPIKKEVVNAKDLLSLVVDNVEDFIEEAARRAYMGHTGLSEHDWQECSPYNRDLWIKIVRLVLEPLIKKKK